MLYVYIYHYILKFVIHNIHNYQISQTLSKIVKIL